MKLRLLGLLCLAAVASCAWFSLPGQGDRPPAVAWVEVAPGVFRSPGLPAGYALVEGDAALLIDAPVSGDGLKKHGVKRIEPVLLTHHHRDSCAAAAGFLDEGMMVRAPKASAEWLTPEGVRKFWDGAVPLRGSRTAYFMVPVGLERIDCTLADGEVLQWRGWTIQVLATPGHSRDHVAYGARKGKDSGLMLFCGDAFAAPGKLPTPYTTDWDHWTDAGLKPAAESLRKLAVLKSALLLPSHGPVVSREAVAALEQTAAVVEELAFLKSFERYTKQRLGQAPDYRFLAKEQAQSNGSKPWTQVSDHLFLTGNTYVLTSKDNAFLVIDPWDQRGADQVAKLKKDRSLGALEVVLFSHAHFDHYDGVFPLPERERFEVWMLDQAAGPVAEPFRYRQPFLDARPVRIDRRPKEGDTLAWREYRFRFHHLPGQTEYTMGVETTIDGKRCFFTADNFFHQDQFSGTGGWMGLNRGWPLPYAASAQKVLDAAPEWVLAEHGGPFEFSAEDFRRRVRWGKESARAADALCLSGQHRHDWNPHRVHVEPFLHKARAGAELKGTLVAENERARPDRLTVTLEGRGLIADQAWQLEPAAGQTVRQEIGFRISEKSPPGRHVFALRVAEAETRDAVDSFVVVDVVP